MSASGQTRRFGVLPSTSGPVPGTDIDPIPRNVWYPSMRRKRRLRHRDNYRLWRSGNSQAVRRFRILACVKLLHHSATAKEYCPSSSAVARHFPNPRQGTRQEYQGSRRCALARLGSAFRHSTRRGIGPYATVPSRCDASPSMSTLSR